MRFAKYNCKVVDKMVDKRDIAIDMPRWGAEDCWFRDENIANGIREKVSDKVILKDAPFASWLLARLWYLTEAEIKVGLNIYEDDIGCQDGGWYYCRFIIEDNNNIAIALLFIEACDYFEQIYLLECSENIDPTELINVIEAMIIAEPNKISECRIIIEDPEENRKRLEYGWDGVRFLGLRQIF